MRRVADALILAAGVLNCGLAIALLLFSAARAQMAIAAFAGSGLGWRYRSTRPPG